MAFLLAQLGAHAAARYAARAAQIGLTPPLTGILRLVAINPGRSQQSLASALGVLPSRVVAFIDDLEQRGLLRRERNATDRRLYALHLTGAGREALSRVRIIADAHETELTSDLTDNERAQLRGLLSRVAAQQGLTPGVHPGYRRTNTAQAADDAGAAQPRPAPVRSSPKV